MATEARPVVTLVLGGARSGKSAFAQLLVTESAGPVLFVATARATDEEMAARIEAHRAARPTGWMVAEAPLRPAQAIRGWAGEVGTVLLDCLSLLVSNLMAEGSCAPGTETDEVALVAQAERELADVLGAARARGSALIIVTNEVGWGVVPPYPLGRLYRDVLGRVNQRAAEAADAVYLMVAGIPLQVKKPPSKLGS